MTPTETVRLIAEITQLYPSMKINDYTSDAWHPVLEDLTFPDALAAVHSLARTKTGYIAPFDIRHQAAKSAGLLPIAEAEALQMATRVASNEGIGARALPEPVQTAYWRMGGAPAFGASPGTLRPQWGRVYREAAEELEHALLGGDLGTAIEAKRHAALETARTPHHAIEGH